MILAEAVVYVWVLIAGIDGKTTPPIPFTSLRECIAAQTKAIGDHSEEDLVNKVKLDGFSCIRVPLKSDTPVDK